MENTGKPIFHGDVSIIVSTENLQKKGNTNETIDTIELMEESTQSVGSLKVISLKRASSNRLRI